jgi:hypothetical protein
MIGRLRSEQGGFSIVEGVIGALLLTVGALGTLQVFDAGTRNTYRAEESQSLNNRLQAELEQIKALPYGEVALTEAPVSSADSNDPRWRVSGTRYALDRDGSNLSQMVYNGAEAPDGETVEGGEVTPGPEPFTVGDVSGQIHRFVAWTGDPGCPECGAGLVKRVVVAATIDEAPISFERRFQEIQTEIVDPDATLDDNPAPYQDEIDAGTVSHFLTDTTCVESERHVLTSDHPAHNTRGRCEDGEQTGEIRGAPDLMLGEPPNEDNEPDPENLVQFDYATDSEPAEGAGEDIGIAMPWPAGNSCVTESTLGVAQAREAVDGTLALETAPGDLDGLLDLPGSDPNKHLRVHTWVSPPVGGSGGALAGKGTLELRTKTINGAAHQGEICATLFVRRTVDVPVCAEPCAGEPTQVPLEVDVPVLNTGSQTELEGLRCEQGNQLPYFACSMTSWPTAWSEVSMPMDFVGADSTGATGPVDLQPGDRVGVSLMVKRDGTEPGQGLEFMYDAINYESRLELETDQLIPFG